MLSTCASGTQCAPPASDEGLLELRSELEIQAEVAAAYKLEIDSFVARVEGLTADLNRDADATNDAVAGLDRQLEALATMGPEVCSLTACLPELVRAEVRTAAQEVRQWLQSQVDRIEDSCNVQIRRLAPRRLSTPPTRSCDTSRTRRASSLGSWIPSLAASRAASVCFSRPASRARLAPLNEFGSPCGPTPAAASASAEAPAEAAALPVDLAPLPEFSRGRLVRECSSDRPRH